MSQYFINPNSFGVPVPPVVSDGSWTEVGRTQLGAPGDDITVSGLPNKEYYMYLVDIPPAVDLQTNLRLGAGGVDSGANYASRDSNNGLADVARPSANEILLTVNSVINEFHVQYGYISNLWGHEKTMTGYGMRGQEAVSNDNFRSQIAGKWSNLSPLDTINIHNAGTGSFPTSSELVVLAWSRFDPQLVNFWDLLGEATAGGGETTLPTPIFAKKKYLWLNTQMQPDGASAFAWQAQIGDTVVDTGNNYDERLANGNFPDQLNNNAPNLGITNFSGSPTYSNTIFVNKDGQEKGHIMRSYADTGGTPPADVQRTQQSGKYAVQAGQINIGRLFRFAGTEVLGAGSKITFWGHD